METKNYKTHCLQCQTPLPIHANARICSHNCTYCLNCAENNNGICKNCGETLQPRKIYPPSKN